MDEPKNRDLGTIDSAISNCTEKVKSHQKQSQTILMIVGGFLIVLAFLSFTVYYELLNKSTFPDVSVLYMVLAFVIMFFGVFMSVYRFHLKEASKYNHLHIAFLRVRVAGNNTEEGFQSEVRQALTENAFQLELNSAKNVFNSRKKIESPIPGHPSSDLSTLVINKLLDNIEFQKKESDK